MYNKTYIINQLGDIKMNFTKLDNGQYDGFAIIKKYDKKISSKGSAYLDIILADKTGEISAKKWTVTSLDETLTADMIVKVRGEMEIYNGREQFKILQMRLTADSDKVKMNDLIPCSPYAGEKMYNDIYNLVSAFKDKDLSGIVLETLKVNKEKLIYYPAALRLHHAINGGLLYHTLSIVRMAEKVADIYPSIDKELLLSGAILHDIAKTWELEVANTGIAKGYTAEGELIGHLVKGAINLEIFGQKLGTDREKLTLLQHMVLSHHGQPDFGAAVRPMFLEAEILSVLDNLDATIFEFNNAVSKVEPGAFSDRQWALDNRKLYNHARTNTEHFAKLDD